MPQLLAQQMATSAVALISPSKPPSVLHGDPFKSARTYVHLPESSSEGAVILGPEKHERLHLLYLAY